MSTFPESRSLDTRPAAIEFATLGGEASQAGDLAWTYGSAKWTESEGHYVRVWQKRAGGAQEKFIGYRLLSLPAETERMLYDLADAGFERLATLTSRSNAKME